MIFVCFASRSKSNRRASINQNAMLVPGKGFSLHFSQSNNCLIDTETVHSRLLPDALARFRRPWKHRLSEPPSKGLRQPVIRHHRVCCAAASLKCCRSKITSHISSSRSKIGSKTSTSRVSPDPSMGGDRCSRPDRGCSGQSVPRKSIGVPVRTVKIRSGSAPS